MTGWRKRQIADKVSKQVYWNFLEDLRQSGITNMFGAAPYLRSEEHTSELQSH